MDKGKINVLFCALGLYDTHGGIQRFNRRVLRCLDQLSSEGAVDYSVFGLRDNQGASGKICPFHGNRVRFFVKTFSKVIGSDVLLLGHINLLPFAIISGILRPGLKIILFVHGVEVWGSEPSLGRRILSRIGIHFVNNFACVSKYTSQKLKDRYPCVSGRVVYFPNAIDPRFEERRLTKSCSATKILTVTRLTAGESEKHVDKVIKALAILNQNGRKFLLYIVGDGEIRYELETLAESLGLSDDIHFLGSVSEAELDRVFSTSDLFVLPSTKEGFGIVYLEAWLRGMPVIGSNMAGSDEVITHGFDGYKVDPANVALLAAYIEELGSNPDLRIQMGENGKGTIRNMYLHDHFYGRFKQLLDNKS